MAFRNVSAVASRPTHFSKQERFSGGGGKSFSVSIDAWCKTAGVKMGVGSKRSSLISSPA